MIVVLLLAILAIGANSPALGEGRRLEDSPWRSTPTSDDLQACSPTPDPPKGRAVATCKVGLRGRLEDCAFDRVVGGAPMRSWAACAVSKFVAKSELQGRIVEIPIEPTDETNTAPPTKTPAR